MKTLMRVFEHLVACGASDDDLSLFERLFTNETLQPASSTALFDRLSEALIEIPCDTWSRRSVHALVRVPDESYYDRNHQMLLRSCDLNDLDYRDAFEKLIAPIQRYVACPNEITALGLYKAFDFDCLISEHHALEGINAQIFLKTLRRHDAAGRAFHIFALFVCFRSDNPHIIQNFLFALLATSGPVPLALLDVLGRYEIYNSPSYNLIERIPNLSATDRFRLIFTHLKSMDETYHAGKLDVIETCGNKDAKTWAALNVSSAASIQYFCKHLMAQSVTDHHILAAVDHYCWAASKLAQQDGLSSPKNATQVWDFEAMLRRYLTRHIDHISGSDEAISAMPQRYTQLKQMSEAWRYNSVVNHGDDGIDSVLDAIEQTFAHPRFDDIVGDRAPDLADQSNGYTSLLRPAGHRYSLYIQAKIAASERWFPRELVRAQAGDFSNWGTLTLLLQTGPQFSALSTWLLKELANNALPKRVLEALISDVLLHYPANSELLLPAHALFLKVLELQYSNWVPQALSALHKHTSNGNALPTELIPALKALDTEQLRRLHQHFLDRLLNL